MAAKYEEIDRVTDQHNGLPVRLVLQKRLDQELCPYHCLSWRTRYQSAPGKSRRLYRSKEYGVWTIPVKVALNLLRQASVRRMLDAQYNDERDSHPAWLKDGSRLSRIIDSTILDASERRGLLDTIICKNGEAEWGDNPVFVMSHSESSDGVWRKIMLVDTKRELCTFRSTTTFVDYKMGINDPGIYPWRLDNAMQEASAASMREFLRVLEEVCQ